MAGQLTFRSALYDAAASGLAMGVIGLLGVAAREPWLFPSLGPTIFLQTVAPEDRSSKPWSVLAGHAAGVAAGFAAVYICGAAGDPGALSAHGPSLPRVLATVLAIMGAMVGQRALRAIHAPAAATTMLIALGSFPASWRTLEALTVGVLLVCALGEAARLLRRRLDAHYGWPDGPRASEPQPP